MREDLPENIQKKDKNNKIKNEKGALTKLEKRHRGQLAPGILKKYFSSGGICRFIGFILSQIAIVATKMMSDYWVGAWAEDTFKLTTQNYILVYGLAMICLLCFGAIRSFLWAQYCSIISLECFQKLFKNVIKKPMSYFDTTPNGQILSLMGKDIDIIDSFLPQIGTLLFTLLFFFLGSFLLIPFSNIFLLPMLILLGVVCFFMVRVYLRVIRELKRLELGNYSPIISNILELYQGLSQFRFYRQFDSSEAKYAMKVNHLNRSFINAKFTGPAFFLYMGLLMDLVVFICYIFVMLGVVYDWRGVPKDITVISLAMSWIFNIPNFINMFIFVYTEYIQGMNSYERIILNVDSEVSEGPRTLPAPKSKDFPRRGCLEVRNIKCRYRDNLLLIINGLSFKVEHGEKVGIVGRTGSGKSSLLLAITRIINIENNEYYVNIAKHQKLQDRRAEYGMSTQNFQIKSGDSSNKAKSNITSQTKWDSQSQFKTEEK